MSFWSRFEEFFMKWFVGPRGDPSTLREYAHTIGAREAEKPDFSRNNIVDWSVAMSYIRGMYRTENHYLSILFYDVNSKPVGYQYIYYDFDDEDDPSRALREAREFVDSIRDRFGAEPVIYFSGRKGYGVLVVVDRVIDFETYRRIWNALKAPFSFSTLDRKVLDARRVHRIPYTYNVKPDRVGICYLVDRRFERIKMEDFDWSNYESLRIDQVKDLLVSVSGFSVPKPRKVVIYGKRELKPLPRDPAELDKCDAVPPCIRNIIQALKASGNPDHWQRVALVLYLKWVGYSIEDIIDLFRRYASDFNERVTTYQVRYIYGLEGSKVDWVMFSCHKMKYGNDKGFPGGLCLGCGWNRNPVTYTYARAHVPEEVKERFFKRVKECGGGENG